MKKIVAVPSNDRSKFLSVMTAEILNKKGLSQGFLRFLNDQDFNQDSKGFLNEVARVGFNFQGKLTQNEKNILKEFLNEISSKLLSFLNKKPEIDRCLSWLMQDPQNITIKNALNTMIALTVQIHDKPLVEAMYGEDKPWLTKLPTLNAPDQFPTVSIFENCNVLWKDSDNFFVMPSDNLKTRKNNIVFAVDADLKPVIIKRIGLENIGKNLWENEKKVLQKLSRQDSNILKEIAIFELKTCVYLVLPVMGFFYGPGPKCVWRDTYECFKTPEPTELKISLAKHYFSLFVDVVKHLHDHNIFHRDLKPENGLLDGQGQLKVTDFEFATTEAKVSKVMMGTDGFVHPDYQKKYLKNAHLDLWALGATLFAMCVDDTLTKSDSYFNAEGITCARRQLENNFEQNSIPDSATIKKIISSLTVNIGRCSSSQDVLQTISTYTHQWRQDDNHVVEMLRQFGKVKIQL